MHAVEKLERCHWLVIRRIVLSLASSYQYKGLHQSLKGFQNTVLLALPDVKVLCKISLLIDGAIASTFPNIPLHSVPAFCHPHSALLPSRFQDCSNLIIRLWRIPFDSVIVVSGARGLPYLNDFAYVWIGDRSGCISAQRVEVKTGGSLSDMGHPSHKNQLTT